MVNSQSPDFRGGGAAKSFPKGQKNYIAIDYFSSLQRMAELNEILHVQGKKWRVQGAHI